MEVEIVAMAAVWPEAACRPPSAHTAHHPVQLRKKIPIFAMVRNVAPQTYVHNS